MAPAAQVRRSRQEWGGRGKGGGEERGRLRSGSREMRKKVSVAPSVSPPPPFFFCDGCKAVDHAPDLSLFLIKILYLKARGTKNK